ncbi:MAG: hypothetical protein AAGD01_10390 [Acidobacteriota bacterium]
MFIARAPRRPAAGSLWFPVSPEAPPSAPSPPFAEDKAPQDSDQESPILSSPMRSRLPAIHSTMRLLPLLLATLLLLSAAAWAQTEAPPEVPPQAPPEAPLEGAEDSQTSSSESIEGAAADGAATSPLNEAQSNPAGNLTDSTIDSTVRSASAAQPPQTAVSLGEADQTLLTGLSWRSLGPRVAGELLSPGPLAVNSRFPARLFASFAGAGGLTTTIPRLGDDADPRWYLAVPLTPGRAVPSQRNDERVYGTADNGIVLRYDSDSDELRAVSVWPDLPLGPEDEVLYRFHPRAPLFFSPHDDEVLYLGGNLLFQTTDGGLSWAAVSPDLAPTGGTLTTALESPRQSGVFWTGGSDGRVHLSQDFGESWEDRTPPTLPPGTEIRSMDPHPIQRGGLYLTAGATGDPEARVLRTRDWGRTWESAGRGLDGPAWVVRADPRRTGLLFAGVARGVRVSFDNGDSWRPLSGLPQAPVVDLQIGAEGLLASVQGQGIWQLPDLVPLRQWTRSVAASPVHLFQPAPAIRRQGLEPGAAALWLWLRQSPTSEEARLEILDDSGQPVRSFNASLLQGAAPGNGADPQIPAKGAPFAPAPGLSLFLWDLRFPGPTQLPGEEAPLGPPAPPGNYLVRLTVGNNSVTAQLPVLADPRSTAPADAQRAGFNYLLEIRNLRSRLRDTVRTIQTLPSALPTEPQLDLQPRREARAQLAAIAGQLEAPQAGTLLGLDRKLAHLAAGHQGVLDRPTDSALAVLDRLQERSSELLSQCSELLSPQSVAAVQENRRADGEDLREASASSPASAAADPEAAQNDASQGEAAENQQADRQARGEGDSLEVRSLQELPPPAAPSAADETPEDTDSSLPSSNASAADEPSDAQQASQSSEEQEAPPTEPTESNSTSPRFDATGSDAG